jgi:hypothetical protein
MANQQPPKGTVKGRVGGVRRPDPPVESVEAPMPTGPHRRVAGPPPPPGVADRGPIDESTAIPAEDLATGRHRRVPPEE